MMTSALLIILTSVLIVTLWLAVHYQFADKKKFLQAAGLAVFWVVLLLAVGRSGILTDFSVFPAPFMFFFPSMILFSVFLAFSKFGTVIVQHVTLAHLVLFQSFRILAEVALFRALAEGLAPVQMTIEGYNFDIVTGVLALFLGFYLRKIQGKNHGVKLAFLFNVMGLGFLSVIAFIALTSMPTPLRVFMNEPSNIWVTGWPYILLPGVLVVAAITGHLLIFRLLARNHPAARHLS